MKGSHLLKKLALTCALLGPLAAHATILPVGANYSIKDMPNHIQVQISAFKMRLNPEYELNHEGDYLDIRKREGRVGLTVRAIPGEAGETNHLKNINRSKGEVNVEVVSGGKRYDFYYSDVETNSELLSLHLNRQKRPKVVHLDSKNLAIQSINKLPVVINEAPLVDDSGFTGKDGVLDSLRRDYFTYDNKVMMLKKTATASDMTIYKRLKSIDLSKATDQNLDAYVDISSLENGKYVKFRFVVESENGDAFLLGNPLRDANFKSECLEFAKNRDFKSERTEKGVALSLYLRSDLYYACMVGKTLLGSVQVFDENLNTVRVRY